MKENADAPGPFELLEPVNTRRPPGLKGTTISTDPALTWSQSGTAEIYYQTPDLKWYVDGAGGLYSPTTLEVYLRQVI